MWIVDPATKMVTVLSLGWLSHRLTVADTLDGGAVLPGFQLAVADIFAEMTLT